MHANSIAEAQPRSQSRWMLATFMAIGALYVGSTIPTPLYPLYRSEFGFSELVVTEIYAVYVIGNLAVLSAFGRLSDQWGRRPTTLTALGITALSALVFLCATDTPWLFAARVLNGFAAGLGAGAVTAWIAELEPTQDRARAAVIASVGNLAGLVLGALGGGLLAQYGPWPLRTSFLLYLALLGVMLVVTRGVPETVKHPVRDLRGLSLRPRIGVPRGIRLVFVAPAALAFASFALGGFYSALAPGLLATSLDQHNLAVVGTVVGTFFASACATAFGTRALGSRRAVLLALMAFLGGLSLLLLAENLSSMSILIAATVIAGAALALGYRSSLQIVNEIAPATQRAEVVSTYLLVSFLGNSLPVIGVGLLAQLTSAQTAHRVFAGVLVVLALTAWTIWSRYGPR
jgi:MFS family permease